MRGGDDYFNSSMAPVEVVAEVVLLCAVHDVWLCSELLSVVVVVVVGFNDRTLCVQLIGRTIIIT